MQCSKTEMKEEEKHMDFQICFPGDEDRMKICYRGVYYSVWNILFKRRLDKLAEQLYTLANRSEYQGLIDCCLPSWQTHIDRLKKEGHNSGYMRIKREEFWYDPDPIYKIQIGQILYATTNHQIQINSLKRYALILCERTWADTIENIAMFLVELSKKESCGGWGKLVPVGILPAIHHDISNYPVCTPEERVVFLEQIKDRLDYYRENYHR